MAKGLSVTLGITVVAFFAVALMASLGIERIAQLDQRVNLKTVPLVSERVEVAVYGMSAVEEGSLEIEMRGKYNLSREDGGEISYRFDSFIPSRDETLSSEINPPEDVYFDIESEGKSKYICVEKSDTVTLASGEC